MKSCDNYYVYLYLRIDGSPYYVGKGKGRRMLRRNKRERFQCPEDKSRAVKVLENLTEEQAFRYERLLISFYGRKDNNTGILRNLTDGGDGVYGRVVSPLERERCKAIGRKCVDNKLGIHRYPDDVKRLWRQKGSKASALVNSRDFTVKTLDGELVSGVSVSDFTRRLGVPQGNFSQMLNGKQLYAHGYVLPDTPVMWYTLTHQSGESFVVCQYASYPEICSKYALELSGFCRLLSGAIQTRKGWRVSSTRIV